MKAYLFTTGALFAVLAVAHVLRTRANLAHNNRLAAGRSSRDHEPPLLIRDYKAVEEIQ